MAKRRYSRLAKVEQKKHIRSTFIFGGLSVLLIIIIIFFGLPGLAKLAGFLTDLNQSTQPIEISDNTPPAPPQLEAPLEFTNESKMQIEGTAEAGSTVKLFINDLEKEVVVNDGGRFSISFSLKKGENSLYTQAIDKSGNESTDSKRYTITFDIKAPLLEIVEPQNGSTITGESKSTVEIVGITEAGAIVTINERVAVVDSNGNFKFSTKLSEGENKFAIVASDLAGNTTEENLTLNFSK